MLRHVRSCTLQQFLKGMQVLLSRTGRSALHAVPRPQGRRARPEQAPVYCTSLPFVLKQPCPIHVSLAIVLMLIVLLVPAQEDRLLSTRCSKGTAAAAKSPAAKHDDVCLLLCSMQQSYTQYTDFWLLCV